VIGRRFRDGVTRRRGDQTMNEGGRAAGTERATQTADLADRSPQELGGLDHEEFASVESMKDFQDCSARCVKMIMPP